MGVLSIDDCRMSNEKTICCRQVGGQGANKSAFSGQRSAVSKKEMASESRPWQSPDFVQEETWAGKYLLSVPSVLSYEFLNI